MLATANTPLTDFFFMGIESTTVNSAKRLRPTVPSFRSTPQGNSVNKESEELLPLPENLTCMCSISLYWFCKISSCLKPHDAKVADDQYNDVAKC